MAALKMDFGAGVFLWFMFSCSGVSASAPGDEHRLCINTGYSVEDHDVILFNSYNYVNLVTGFFPPPVWSQANLDGNGIGVSGLESRQLWPIII